MVGGEGDGMATRAEEDVLGGAVVLDEVEVSGGEILEGITQVTDGGDSFEEDFGEDDRGAYIYIDASGMQPTHLGGEEAKVVEGSCAQGGTVGSRMEVEDVGADGQMHRKGHALLVGCGQ